MPASKQSFVCNRTRAKQLIMSLPSLLFLVLISFLRHIFFGWLLLQRKCIWHLVTPLWGVELMKADPSPSIRPHMVPTKNHTAAPKVTYFFSFLVFGFGSRFLLLLAPLSLALPEALEDGEFRHSWQSTAWLASNEMDSWLKSRTNEYLR